MYYTIETVASGWAVSHGGRRLDTFRTHAEASAFIRGRRSYQADLTDRRTVGTSQSWLRRQSAAQTG